jgi:GT2 family glycosyltransferase
VIAGCKQVGWDDGRLLDVGFTTSPLGKKVTGVDVDDVDQGQLDHRSDVLAVSTAGMLVRRDVWDALGGPDPTLVRARDDLDLCRRAHLAGYRVIVVPQAVVAHAEAGASGRRPFSTPRAWARADRRDAVHLRLAATAWVAMPFVIAWTLGAAVLRAIGRLVLKQPGRACDARRRRARTAETWAQVPGPAAHPRLPPGVVARRQRLNAPPRQIAGPARRDGGPPRQDARLAGR